MEATHILKNMEPTFPNHQSKLQFEAEAGAVRLKGNTAPRTKRSSTREKIEKMVTEGAKNYPAYLKLIYTGESDFSSEDEAPTDKRKPNRPPGVSTESPRRQLHQTQSLDVGSTQGHTNNLPSNNESSSSCVKNNEGIIESHAVLQTSNDKDSETVVKDKTGSGGRKWFMRRSKSLNENFYDTSEYDNVINQNQLSEDPEVTAKQEEEWNEELMKVEQEIATLRSVLSARLKQSQELKRKLGITTMTEFTHDVKQGFQNIKESDAYKKTSDQITVLNEKITGSEVYQKTNTKIHQLGESISGSDAYQKTNAAFKAVGAYASMKVGALRNSNTFKSFEEKIGGAYSNVKTRVSGSKSENDFNEALSASAEMKEKEEGETNESASKLPEDKVPL